MFHPPLGRLYQNVINLDVICQRPEDGKSSQGSYYSWWTVIQSGWCKLFRTIWSERSRVKRYGVIFTYLASCEVHLEFAASLTSMHCTVLFQMEDKLRGFALTIGQHYWCRTWAYQIHTRMEQSQIQSAICYRKKHGKFFLASLGTRALGPSSKAT